MSNPEITNNDCLKVPAFNPQYQDATVTFTAAGTYTAGTIMARLTAAPTKWVPYLAGAATGAEIPKGVLATAVTATAAGDKLSRVLISGEVSLDAISIDAGGAISQAVRDQLRDYSIVAIEAVRNDELDNQ